MLAKSVVALAFVASAVVAQNTTIDPSSVDLTLRSQWCQGQQNTCGTLCSGAISANTCSPNTLNFTCTCSANGSTPGLQYYLETMPTFICEQVFSNCNAANVGDASAQALCKTTEQANCGHLNPENFTKVSTSSSSSATTATASGPTASGTAASSTSSKAAAATLAAVRNFGTGAVAVGVAAAFGYIL